MTDGSANQTWSATYLPFGQEWNPQSTPNHYKFTGKQRDAESGLDEFGARYYSSSMGRWATPDWAAKPTAVPYAMFGNPQSLNLYSYVGNNPLMHADPDGHCWPAQSCYQAIANFVNNFSNKVFNNSANSSPAVAALKTFGAGVLASTVKMAASPLTMGTATGTCMGGSGCSAGGTALAVGGDVLKGAAIAGGLSAAAGSLTGAATTDAVRGMSEFGGIMSAETNAAGGTVYTSVGGIGQSDVGAAVNSAMYSGGDINILSGVHGAADGTMTAAPEFFQSDLAKFGDLPGVTVHDMTTLTPAQVNGMVNGPGTTIGAFCNSGACLPK
jgi:RHS repeat-associated protein